MLRKEEEEAVNAVTHFVSALLALLFTFLTIFTKDFNVTQSFPVFLLGATAGWTFFSSYLYHSSLENPQNKRNQLVDRAAIYLMIAGNGGALCLAGSWSLSSLICCLLLVLLGAAGVVNICVRKNVSETFSVASYVLMGWISALPVTGMFGPCTLSDGWVLTLFLSGGAAYSIGIIFYVQDNKKWFHTIWHFFVMAGFGLHFLSVLHAVQS